MKSHLIVLSFLLFVAGAPIAAASEACCAPGMSRAGADPVKRILVSYEAVSNALAGDDLAKAKTAAGDFVTLAEAIMEKTGCADGEKECPLGGEKCTEVAKGIQEAKDMKGAREAFRKLSAQMVKLAEGRDDFYLMNCPMAGKNGDWVQSDKELRNPYFGSSMLRCGTVRPAKKS